MDPDADISRFLGYGRYQFGYIGGYEGSFNRGRPRHPNKRQRPVESHKTTAARLSKKERKRRKQARRR